LIVKSILVSNDLINQIFEGARGPIIFVDTSKKDKIRVLLIIFCEGELDNESSLTSTVATISDRNADARTAKMHDGGVNCSNGLFGQTGLVGHIGLIELISLVGHICISGLVGQISLAGLNSHIIGLNGLNDFSLVGLSGPSDIMGLIGLGFVGLISLNLVSLVKLNGHISLVGLGCFSGWHACAMTKMWYSDNNDALQDCFTAAILAAAARTNEVAIDHQNYQCGNLVLLRCLLLVCEGGFVVACA
jgi:hypothetical protein